MLLAYGKLYALNKSADTFVLKASPQFELLATNSLGEETMSLIAPWDGDLFIRTYRSRWCVSGKK